MAPTTTIETVTVARPIKVIALVCCLLAVILCIVAIASTNWLEAAGYRQGLWEECEWTAVEDKGCKPNAPKPWIQACAGLTITSLLICVLGAILTAIGLSRRTDKKFFFYRLAMVVMFVAVGLLVIELIVFPAKFMQEVQQRQKPEWYFGWAYGVAWGAAIFMFGAGILLLLDKESEEIYYREKTTYSRETDA